MKLRLLLLLLLLTLLAAPAASLAAAPAAPPNIIYIMADDLGYGDIGPFGQKKIRTPNLDRMAAEGTSFDHFYAGACVCSPTRSALMTGQHTGHTRVRGNHGQAGISRVPLKADDITVAEVLKSAGYATAIAGKWGLGEPGNEGIPNRQGFDHWFGYLNNDLAEFYYPEKIWKNEQEIALPGNLDGKRGQYSNDLMTEEALAFLASNRTRPFFLYLAYTIPHSLLEVPDDSLAEYLGKFEEPPATEKGNKNATPTPRATFAAMVTRLDREVGRLFARLRDLGLDQNTIVFFCSDNGAPDRQPLTQFFGSYGAFRGKKGTLFEGGTRVPMIVRWPGHVPAGRRSDFVWAGWDFLPTAAALAGVPTQGSSKTGARLPPNLDGINVLPALRGERLDVDRVLYWEHHANRFFQAIRAGNLKAYRESPDTPPEIFDLRADPGETRNLAASQPAFVARATELFRTSRTESEHWPIGRSRKKKS
ncbi:MAG: arylsulfatase [Verrucomicrobia bacterium]|nr:arylsulfatase [Verrucomicrobiota bacterium]